MRAPVTAAAAVLLLAAAAGCAGPDLQARRAADDDLKCAGYGITSVDPAYPQCRASFARQRATQQENAMNALTLHGGYLPQQAPYIEGTPGAVALLPPPLTSCWPSAPGWNCYREFH